MCVCVQCLCTHYYYVCVFLPGAASKATSTNDIAATIGSSILNSLQLNDVVAASGTGATAESLLQSVVNLVGAAQAVAAVTSTAESITTATATVEDTGKGTYNM